MANGSKIADRAAKSGGILGINLGELRDELGFARIGRKILSTMSEHLTENNLGCFPGWVLDGEQNPEPRQWQDVYVYVRDGSVQSAILDAVSDPGQHDIVAAFKMLSGEAPDYSKMKEPERLALVRAIVCK